MKENSFTLHKCHARIYKRLHLNCSLKSVFFACAHKTNKDSEKNAQHFIV